VAVALRLFDFVKPHRGRVLAAVSASVFFAAASAVYAALSGPLLKLLLSGDGAGRLPFLGARSGRELLFALPVLLVVAAAVRASAQALNAYLLQTAAQRVVADLRRALYARFLHLPQAVADARHSGDLVSRFGADIQSIELALTFALSSYLRDPLQLLFLLGVCAFLDLQLLGIALATLPLAALPIARFASRLKRVADEAQASLGALSSRVGEGLANARVVQAFRREEDELLRLDEEQQRYLAQMRTSFLLRATFTPVLELMGAAGLCAAVWFAGRAIARGSLSPEALLSFLAALLLMYQPLKALAGTGQQVLAGLAAAGRVFEILEGPEAPEEPRAPKPARFERELALRNVSFSFGERPALEEVTLTVERGRTLALVGESGSGKSTLAALLLRFHDPSSGRIELDGVDLRELRVSDLRGLTAFVPQEAVLFAGTLEDNVACAREGASEEEVLAALSAANASELAQRLGGLQAEVGERGARLSGGERQRVSLARAFLKDAPLIVLDEATSALDPSSEALVQEGLARLLAGRTAIIVAHRLATVARADEIAVLSGGRLVERGTHRSLLARGGAYAALHAAQAGRSPRAEGESEAASAS
jgi:subfamily B ATP-binding cassette protein MsbA